MVARIVRVTFGARGAADLAVMDDGGIEPRHRQHIAVVKVDVNHRPVHILQLAHLILAGCQLIENFEAVN